MMTAAMLTGQSDHHLVPLTGRHRLMSDAVCAFKQMQIAAEQAGFDLQPASSFRDFARQQTLWNEKFRGLRPVLDANSQPLDISNFNEQQRAHAILRWSALPGASRHHWGTDLDIYDPTLLPAGQTLQLEPWEYQQNGYFYPLNDWLTANMDKYGFFRPFVNDRNGVAPEPWHLSYRPLAEQAEKMLTPALLLSAWENKDIAGYSWLASHLDDIFKRYIHNQTEA